MILSGDPITAEEARSLGLVMKVVPKGKVLEESKNFAAKLAALPRLAMEASKMLINRGLEVDLASGLEMEAHCFGNLTTTNDLKEETSAFLEERKPNGNLKTELFRSAYSIVMCEDSIVVPKLGEE